MRALPLAGLLLAAGLAFSSGALAMPAAEQDAAAPGPVIDDVQTRAIESYAVRRGFRSLVERAQLARDTFERLSPGMKLSVPVTGQAVSGTVAVPVIPLKFANTPQDPIALSQLRAQLFDGPWPSGTMSEDYFEMSLGRLTVEGTVTDWVQLSQPDTFYSGPAPCHGLCTAAALSTLVFEGLKGADATLNYADFDFDGDGYVDFVALVHPEMGGECTNLPNDNMWSHRYSYRQLTGQDFVTGDVGPTGAPILIDDYVVMPALACDNQTMIQIGVFAHEFGHAFGLPDLYDTSNPARSEGLGNWDLMAAGSWGGDNRSPETPSHMSAWSKQYLGWVTPREIGADTIGVELSPIRTTGDVVRVDYSTAADPEDVRYLLLEYRPQAGFDKTLRAGGLLVTEVNSDVVNGGLQSNTVNNQPFAMGVNVIEADGLRNLDRKVNRADAGDMFPGALQVGFVDGSGAEQIRAALCNITQLPDRIRLDIYVSRTSCPGPLDSVAVSPQAAEALPLAIGEELVLKGVLKNLGTNYFTDRKLVLVGADGSSFAVEVPMALEVPNGPGGGEPGPATLSDVLGKEVVVRGKLTLAPTTLDNLSRALRIEELQVQQ